MNPRDALEREELLVGVMAEYDEALAAGSSTLAIDETVAEFDPQVVAQWTGLKKCLELLDQARRSGVNDDSRTTYDERTGFRHSSFVLGHSDFVPTVSPHPNPLPKVEGRCRKIGRFILERELGRGGLGIVYLAHDPQLGRKVALKIPRFEALLDDDLRRRFMREAEAAARLNHPNLVALYDVGEDNLICYLASEYCPGPTLAEWMRDRGEPIPPVESAKLVLALAGAVEHAHSRGVLHRDIKPSNVLLGRGVGSWEQGEGHDQDERNSLVPKLTDFGMAKLLEQGGDDKTRTGAIVGTLAYMAPEQVEGRVDQLDARTDVYALGAILYEILTGVPPFGGQTDVDVLRKLIASEPIAPSRLRRDVPRDLEAITLKCLSRNAAGRYPTAGILATDLQRFLDRKPTVARPLTVSTRLARWTRRRPAIAALMLVSVIAVAIIFGVNQRRMQDVSQVIKESAALRSVADQEHQRAIDGEATRRRFLYDSRMRQAQQAWRDGKGDICRDMIHCYAEGTPDAGLRHFEWYYLNYLMNLPHRSLRGHKGRVYAVAYSPDGRLIVSGGADGTVRLWDAATGALAGVLHEHRGPVSSLVFAADGDMFATSSDDQTVKLWSVSQRKVTAVLPHPFAVDACMFLDGGRLLASLSAEASGWRQSLVWDVKNATVRPEWTPPEGKFQAVIPAQSGRTVVAFVNNFATVWHRQADSWVAGRKIDIVNPRPGATLSPDEEYLLVPVWPRYLHIYRLRDGVLANVLKDHGGGVNCIAFSPMGDQIATSSDDASVCVFEFPSGKLLHRFFGHTNGSVWQVAWSPSGESLASAGNDGMVRVWDIKNGTLRRHLGLPEPRSHDSIGHWGRSQLLETGLWGFAFLQDGQHINSVYHDGLNLTWDLTSAPPKLSAEYLGHSKTPIMPMPAAAASVLARWDSHAYRIPNRYAWVGDVPQKLNGCVRFTGDGSQIIDVARGQLQKWNVWPFQLIEDQKTEQLNRPDLIADVSPDGDVFCGADLDGDVSIYGVNRSADVRLEHNWHLVTACFSSTGDRILLLNNGGVAEYDVYTGKRIRTFSQEAVTATTYSADSQRIAVAYESGCTCIYDAVTGEETLRIDVAASEILFSRDGTSIITDGAPDGGLYYWPGTE